MPFEGTIKTTIYFFLWIAQPACVLLNEFLNFRAQITITHFYLQMLPTAALKITSRVPSTSLQDHPLMMQTTGLTWGWLSRLAPASSHDLTLCPSPRSPSVITRLHNGQSMPRECAYVVVWTVSMLPSDMSYLFKHIIFFLWVSAQVVRLDMTVQLVRFGAQVHKSLCHLHLLSSLLLPLFLQHSSCMALNPKSA